MIESRKLMQDLDREIARSKQVLNDSGYDNSTAFNQIVRRYRNELKELRAIVSDDHFLDGVDRYPVTQD